MTYRRRSWIIIAALSLVSMGTFGQFAAPKGGAKPKVPRWVSDKGYWVLESNINSPRNHIIRFYNTDNVLVHKETLAGVKLNAEKTKVKMRLKKILEASVLAWKKRRQGNEEMPLVKSVL